MAEPSWDEIFGGQPQRPSETPAAPEPVSEEFPTARLSDPYAVAAAQANAAQAQAARAAVTTSTDQPLSRRELREAEARANGGAAQPPAPPQRGRGRGRDQDPYALTRPKRRWGGLVALIVVVALVLGGGAVAWFGFHDKVCKVLTFCQESIDYTGNGDGEKATVVIQSGDIGSDVAKELQRAGVTKTYEAAYRILLKTNQSFEPGSYTLQKQMSAAAALAALKDPKNRVVNSAVIREGITAEQAYKQLSVATGRPVSEFEAAAKDYQALGVPADFPSIEGFLFPATYSFDPGTTAQAALQKLVTTMQQHLQADGVPAGDDLKVLTMASIVQREAGSVADMGKVSRVFQNRLDKGMLLQSDATVSYGTGRTDHVTTTGTERSDKSNPYNTYANPGLPIGPIALPGDDAIKAAMNPTPGPWLYFVAVNLKTGETVFSTTQAEHDAAVKQWQAWCRQSAENMAYCQ
ncbi:endolytic transglycosylase MltG [Pseudolysinimonas sp.]|uniref:endolytic transglycosylase MltG n=1 Tax=Pseudolysinimonas sp. TaxID=2680009 RepID=UPI003F7E2F2F